MQGILSQSLLCNYGVCRVMQIDLFAVENVWSIIIVGKDFLFILRVSYDRNIYVPLLCYLWCSFLHSFLFYNSTHKNLLKSINPHFSLIIKFIPNPIFFFLPHIFFPYFKQILTQPQRPCLYWAHFSVHLNSFFI